MSENIDGKDAYQEESNGIDDSQEEQSRNLYNLNEFSEDETVNFNN
jgi:hypothetical protein